MHAMLAKTIKIEDVPNKLLLAQPKINGIRAMWNTQKQCLETRNGNIINSVPHIIKNIEAQNLNGFPFDGELYTNLIPFQNLNGIVRSYDDKKILNYHIFDLCSDITALKRQSTLDSLKLQNYLTRVPTQKISSQHDVAKLYKEYLSNFEGIILRNPDAKYFEGRTGNLIKIKPIHEMECKLIGFTESTTDLHRFSFGSLILQLKGDGQIFHCAGISDKDREYLWRNKHVGCDITIHYGALSTSGIPQFPRFKCVRTDHKTNYKKPTVIKNVPISITTKKETAMRKKIGAKLKESVPENFKTCLVIDRLLYGELARIAICEGISMQKAINQALRLRVDQFIKSAKKRQKAHLEKELETWKEQNSH